MKRGYVLMFVQRKPFKHQILPLKKMKKKSKDSVEESNSLTIKSRCYFFKRVTTE